MLPSSSTTTWTSGIAVFTIENFGVALYYSISRSDADERAAFGDAGGGGGGGDDEGEFQDPAGM